MLYLLALIFPLTFLYSPKAEKPGAVFVTKTMTISQERNTPAYTAFKYAQKVSQAVVESQKNNIADAIQRLPSSEFLSSENLANKNVIQLAEFVYDKKTLNQQTDEELKNLAVRDEDSSLLEQIKSGKAAPTDVLNQTLAQAAVLRGHFELVDGVAIIDHKVSVKRILEGQTVEVGQVDLNAGSYQISVNSFEGELVAEVKDRFGNLVGEDHQKLMGLTRIQNFFKGPTLKVGQPAAFAFNSRQYDDELNNKLKEDRLQASFFSRNYNLKKTSDVYPNVARHSSTVGFIDSQDDNVASTLSIRTSRDKSETLLFSKKWVSAITDYLAEQIQVEYTRESGVIIGRVLKDGKPLAGAQVVVENQAGLEPHYLNALLIPQVKQTSTSANGLFIIPGVLPGGYQISAYEGSEHLGTQMYFVESQIVSYQEILSSRKVKANVVRSFDMFSGQQVTTDLQIPGFEEILTVNGDLEKYRDRSTSGIMEVLNRPQSNQYIPYIYVQNLSRDYLHLPQISEVFMRYLQEQRKISDVPDTSVFIGFSQYNDYKVYLSGADTENFNANNVVYFDQQGKISEVPVPRGGFVVFNVPAGIQEIMIEDLSSQAENSKTGSQVFYSRPNMNFVAHFEN